MLLELLFVLLFVSPLVVSLLVLSAVPEPDGSVVAEDALIMFPNPSAVMAVCNPPLDIRFCNCAFNNDKALFVAVELDDVLESKVVGDGYTFVTIFTDPAQIPTTFTREVSVICNNAHNLLMNFVTPSSL